jgi:hypothetical protein
MRVPDTSEPIGGTRDSSNPGSDQVLTCDECGAPVDSDQRYCVVCGAHRRNVNDPAARYLSHASARSRRSGRPASAQRAARSGGSRGVALAMAIALIPAAAAVGVIAGRSSNNDDSKLIHALNQHQSAANQTTTVQAKSGSGQSSAAVSSNHGSSKSSSSKSTTSTKGHGSGSGSGKGGGSGSHKQHGTSSRGGGAADSTGDLKATKAKEQQGAQATQKVQKSTGSSYVNGQNSLPGVVVVK